MAITRNGGGAVVSATTSRQGVVQLTDSTSSTSTTTAATPNAVKSAYDLANAAVAKSVVTTAGDLIIGTGNATISRLAIGSNGQALVSNGTTATWATPTDTTKIPLSTVTTAGDLILANGNASVTRLAIGTNGYVLTSDGTTATWAAASAGGASGNDASLAFSVQVYA